MIITCPECSTRFVLDPRILGAVGRAVRCSKCSHVWRQIPPDEGPPPPRPAEVKKTPPSPPPAPQPETAPEPQTSPPPAFDAADDVADTGDAGEAESGDRSPAEKFTVPDLAMAPSDDQPPAGFRRRNLPALAGPRSRSDFMGWMILAAIVTTLLTSIVYFRQGIVDAWPPAKRLYETLGLSLDGVLKGAELAEKAPVQPLKFADIATERVLEAGVVVLVLRGKVVNPTKQPMPVPTLKGTIVDADRKPLYDWKFQAKLQVVGAGKSVEFESRVSNPPAAIASILVEFVTGQAGS